MKTEGWVALGLVAFVLIRGAYGLGKLQDNRPSGFQSSPDPVKLSKDLSEGRPMINESFVQSLHPTWIKRNETVYVMPYNPTSPSSEKEVAVELWSEPTAWGSYEYATFR